MPQAMYKLPLILEPQSESGFTVTCPLLPELITEGDNAEEAIANVRDALAAVIELYQDAGKTLPAGLEQPLNQAPVWFETLVGSS